MNCTSVRLRRSVDLAESPGSGAGHHIARPTFGAARKRILERPFALGRVLREVRRVRAKKKDAKSGGRILASVCATGLARPSVARDVRPDFRIRRQLDIGGPSRGNPNF